jgi:hypothetical protein
MPRIPAFALTVVAVGALAAPAAADWREDLAAQLRWDHDCVLNLLSQVLEREIDGQLVVIAKAHCEDGRVFDVLREGEFEDFELNECTPTDQSC